MRIISIIIIFSEKKDNDGNRLALDLVIGENKITPIDVYGPNTDTPSFYSKVKKTFLNLIMTTLFFVGN